MTSNTVDQLERLPLSERTVDEGWLQALLFEHPTLLPVDELKLDAVPLVPIGREVSVKAGRIDCLYVSPTGQLTVVEVKLWLNPEARRQVVAQVIDYAKELSLWGYEDLDRCARAAAGRGLWELVAAEAGEAGLTEAQFVDEVTRNLKRGDFLLLLVGDGIREDVERMAEFLQSTPHLHFTLALVEMRLYRFPGQDALLALPSVVAQTQEVVRAVVRVEQVDGHSSVSVTMSEPTSREDRGGGDHLLDEVEFLQQFEADSRNDERSLELVKRLLRLCEGDPGLRARWRRTSFSVRLNLGVSERGLPSTLTVYTTGVLKFHNVVFPRNLVDKGVPEAAAAAIASAHERELARVTGPQVTHAVLHGGSGPHIGSLPGGFDALVELLLRTARAVERELGIDRGL